MAFLRSPVGRILVGVLVLFVVLALAQNQVMAALYFIGVAITVLYFIRRRLSQGPLRPSIMGVWHAWVGWIKACFWPVTLTMHLLSRTDRRPAAPAIF